MRATVDVLTDALGGKSYRVARVFPDLESAEAGATALDAFPVGNNPAAESQIGTDVPERDVAVEPTTVAEPTTLVVDEDVIPGCPTGVCGLD